MGNTEAVAIRHYLQVTDEHFDQASGKLAAPAQRALPKNEKNAAQNANINGFFLVR